MRDDEGGKLWWCDSGGAEGRSMGEYRKRSKIGIDVVAKWCHT